MNRPKFFLPKTNCHNTVKEGTAIRHGLPLAAAVSIALVCGCGSHDATDENTQSPVGPTAGFESPEESFEAFQKAGVANDFSGAVSCLSPESYDAVAATITFPLTLTLTAAFDPGKMDEINELLGKYDISMDNDTEEFSINKISDKATYIADVWEWLVENLDDGTTLSTMTTETLGDIAINGDSAQATVTAESGETGDVDFVRLDGRWFLQMPTEPTITSGSGTVVTNDEFEAQFGGDFHQSFTFDDFFSSKSEPPAGTVACGSTAHKFIWQLAVFRLAPTVMHGKRMSQNRFYNADGAVPMVLQFIVVFMFAALLLTSITANIGANDQESGIVAASDGATLQKSLV